MNAATGEQPLLMHSKKLVVLISLAIALWLIVSDFGLALASSPIVVNSTSDDKKGNDGQCTLREAVIAANSDKKSGARSGECPAGNGRDVILLPPGVYRLERTDNGNENSSQTGDLDIETSMEIRRDPALDGVVVIDGYAITDRLFHVFADDVTLADLTIRGGNAQVEGGGILNASGMLRLSNITLTGNRARDRGGAIYNTGSAELVNVTISQNWAPAGSAIANEGTLYLEDSIVSGNAAPACSGMLNSVGASITKPEDGCSTQGAIVDDPRLAAEIDEAGLVLIYGLDAGSPAVNAAAGSNCPASDQRGIARPQGSSCDIGAFEAENQAPIAYPQAITTNEDTPVAVQLTGADGDGDTLYFRIVSGPANGVLTGVAPVFTYTPASNYAGSDSITFVVDDGAVASDEAVISIDVLAQNDPPAAADDAYEIGEDLELVVSGPGVLSNDADVDGDALSAELVSNAGNGMVTLNGDGSFTYRPVRNFDGTDSFTYRSRDIQGALSSVATVTIAVESDGFFEVTSTADSGSGSLRAALDRANLQLGVNTIIFEIAGAGPHTISLTDSLPPITDSIVIDGVHQQNLPPLPPGSIVLDGSAIPGNPSGLTVNASESTISGLTITGFGGSALLLSGGGNGTVADNVLADNGAGIVIRNSGGNQIRDNTIAGATGSNSLTIERDGGDDIVVIGGGVVIVGDGSDEGTLVTTGENRIANNLITANTGNGITIVDSANNPLSNNDIFANTGLPIDLGGDGDSANDLQDADIGANFVQNHPVLNRATPVDSQIRLEGRLNSKPNQSYTLQFFGSPQCDAAQTLLNIELVEIFSDEAGDTLFDLRLPSDLPLGTAISATATDSNGNTSELSDCIVVSADNDSWPRALEITPGTPIEQFLDLPGRSRWYRFPARPETRLTVTLTDLPANYDLTVYKDIAGAYREVREPQDLPRLSAEFAPSAFSPSAFSPSAFSPSAFSPSAFSPSAFSPSAFSPSAFSPSAFSPSAFSPSAFSPSAFSPSAFSPSAFSPSAFSPSAFSPSAFLPSAFSPEAFESAQSRSLIGISAFDETASEGIVLNTWNNYGDIYVRVRGRDGAYSAEQAFHLSVIVEEAACSGLDLAANPLSDTSLQPIAGAHRTLILVDTTRIAYDQDNPQEQLIFEAMNNRLNQLAAHPEVGGVVIDVSQDMRVRDANQLAAVYPGCPFAKNLVAESIKRIVDGYWTANRDALQYIVIVGNDDAIPFFRYPDNALLGHESNYVPPVRDETTSQASLRLGYVLGQDAYGAPFTVSSNAAQFPIPDLAVGRLVETPADIVGMIDTYLATADGVIAPSSGFVTGYDFLVDVAEAMQVVLQDGLGQPVNTLIAPQELSPLDENGGPNPAVWSADDLKLELLGNRYDLIFLAGHFNAVSALAADYTTSLLSTDVLDSPIDMTNSIVFSAGCHSGYNIVNEHGVAGVTAEPDWAQVFARKRATFIGGTGYQYGDTEFIEYSERLYLNFAEELRSADQIAVGDALVAAKQRYLTTTPVLRGIHEKALLQATLFGLPMLRVDLPTPPPVPPDDGSEIDATQSFSTAPGSELGLSYADLNVALSPQQRAIELRNVDSGETIAATWLQADSGIVTNPAEPVLPLKRLNVSMADAVLRGVGFLGGVYSDEADTQPLTGAPTTEVRGVHAPFLSDVFFPIRPWNVNYFGTLSGDGQTYLNITPAQHKSAASGAITSTRRSYSNMGFRLFYSSYVSAPESESRPELADAPAIIGVTASVNGNEITFETNVIGNPAAGIQNVWVTYTGETGDLSGRWQSLDLTQSSQDSTVWQGTLTLSGTSPEELRFVVQAVNGVGLVALTTNQGSYYVPGTSAERQPTALEIVEPFPENSGRFGNLAGFSATLKTNEGMPLADEPVSFGLGLSTRTVRTDGSGTATVSMPILAVPGQYPITAFYSGTPRYAPAAATSNGKYAIQRQESLIRLADTDNPSSNDRGQLLIATLLDGSGLRQVERTVRFTVTGNGIEIGRSVITNLVGEAYLEALSLPSGSYLVEARFDGTPTHLPAQASATIEIVNEPPNCDAARVEPATIWSPQGNLVAVSIVDVIDPEGDNVSIVIDSICQDEAVGQKKEAADGFVDPADAASAQIRAERDGNGNGRVYTLFYTATDARGAACMGVVEGPVVPHDQDDADGSTAVNDGALYDSTTPGAKLNSCPR